VILGACGAGGRDPLLTYYSGDHGLSLRYPASWRTDQSVREGVWYRTFTAPATTPQTAGGVTATLFAGPFDGGVEGCARRYLAGTKLTASHDEEREGVKGRFFDYTAPDGATRSTLLVFAEGADVVGLHVQGEGTAWGRSEAVLRQMATSLSFEKPDTYPRFRDPRFRVAIGMPRSWTESRTFSGGKSLMAQFTSPALAADKGGQTAHASLTLTVEPLSGDTTLDAFYSDTRLKLGGAFEVLSHKRWRDGYADLLSAETPLTISRVKRFYRVSGDRGYGLAFEARDDVLPRVSRWCDAIAATLQVGDEAR
jgi:hypothetical protein